MFIELIKNLLSNLAFFLQCNPGIPKVVGHLHVQPVLRAVLEDFRKFKSHCCRNAALVSANFVHNTWSAAQSFGKICLTHFQRNQEFFLQHIARFCWVNIVWFLHKNTSMVITNSHIFRGGTRPTKHNAPLIVDSYRMKALQISSQSFKSVPRRTSQIFQFCSKIQVVKLFLCSRVQLDVQSLASCFAVQSFKDVSSSLISKRLNHTLSTSLYHNTTQWYKKGRHLSKFLLTPVIAVGCVSRAPTDCELDKRSGLYPSSFCEGKADKGAVEPVQGATAASVKPNEIPVRSEPLVKRVWIHDQILEGGHWMQGTWAYIEVEPSKWVGISTRPSGQTNTSSPKPASIIVPASAKETPKVSKAPQSSARLGGKQ
jgi:hypothetical protein